MNETQDTQQPADTTAIELILNEHSLLVLECNACLTDEHRARLRHDMDRLLAAPGRHVVVLEDGMTCKVVHRPGVSYGLPSDDPCADTPAGVNTGHGHVRPRPDGVRARCGGPGLCVVCRRELAAEVVSTHGAAASALRTILALGYTYHGGEQWKPPLGSAPDWLKQQPGEPT